MSESKAVIHQSALAEIGGWDDVRAICATHDGGSDRRTKLQVSAIDKAIILICDEYAETAITVRQLFYQLVSRDIIPKDEKAYKNLVVKRSGSLRRAGVVPFSRFTDATRWMRKPTTYNSAFEAAYILSLSYRASVWAEVDTRVEIWCEKDALAGVIYPECDKYDVPLMVARGFSSISFLHDAAEQITKTYAEGNVTHLYHFGDYDPSGQAAAVAIEKTLKEMTDAPFTFTQVAINAEQIRRYGLLVRPTKKTEARAKNWVGGEGSEGDVGGSVELDALPPSMLAQLVSDTIESHLPAGWAEQADLNDAIGRQALEEFTENMPLP